jgi:hypothetical protein
MIIRHSALRFRDAPCSSSDAANERELKRGIESRDPNHAIDF